MIRKLSSRPALRAGVAPAPKMYLQGQLSKSFPTKIRQRGETIDQQGQVTRISGNQFKVSADVQGSVLYSIELSRQGDEVHVSCDCPYFASDGPCKHIWATVLAADRKSYLRGKLGGGTVRLVEDLDNIDDVSDLDIDDDDIDVAPASPVYSSRLRAPARPLLPPPPKPPTWRDHLQKLNTATAHRPRSQWDTSREIYYVADVTSAIHKQALCLRLEYREQTKGGKWSKLKPLRISTSEVRELPNALDREILTTLTGASDFAYVYMEESISSEHYLKHAAAEILMPRICATGRCLLVTDSLNPIEELPVLAWDGGDPWDFHLVVDKHPNHWNIRGVLRRGPAQMDLSEPVLMLEAGVLVTRGTVARLSHGGAFQWIALLRKEKGIQVPPTQARDMIAEILKTPHPPGIDLPEDLRFEEIAATPKPIVKFFPSNHPWADRNKLRGQVFFDYDGHAIPFESHAPGLYQPDVMRYLRRDEPAERAALRSLTALGLKEVGPDYTETGPRWEVSSKQLPSAVRELTRAGWHIEAEGKTFRRSSGFSAALTSGIDWFELHGSAEYGDFRVKLPDLLAALKKGDQLVQLDDGSYGILPEEFLDRYGLLTRIGRTEGDHVRFAPSQTGLLDVLLAARPEVQVDQAFARARDEMRRFEGIEAAEQPAGFVGELRGYQCEGLAWMYFLQRIGFGGCLADDMGVGKTPQVLALLEAERATGQKLGASLVVMPRSLIYNWQQEAARFTPQLRVLDHSGANRERGTDSFAGFDLILTTYGTLRRDAALLRDYQFHYVVLDEAQAVKNAASESAKAVRLLKADHRLVMSGTPIENHLGELGSLFEFLNPGMLGAASLLQSSAGALRNPNEETRTLLSKALRPFILRRTKAQVVKELPAKHEQTVYCELEPEQRKLYNDLRDHYRRSLLGRIDAGGMARSKMHILEALLRLRQAACHPGLIDKTRVHESSAKLDALLPQLNEVMEEGHKALVFSQFTSMLGIVRGHLDDMGVTYEYLDGKTRNRQEHIERFQNDPDCKLFLISLKAGGVGLNLTAAEYVFLLDPWWNPAVEAQAIDRTHRIGQLRPVFAYRLIARDTVEEKVLELQKSKRALADAIIGEDNRLIGNLKREDLELLLS
jgi:hypothetical protein